MSLLEKKRRPKIGINIVPLVDVLIVLIFFFLMTMQFRNLNVLDILPPKVETAGPNNIPEELLIGINSEGEYYLNNDQLKFEDLETALAKAGQSELQQPVLVLADENVALKYMTSVMDLTRKAGLEKVRLQVR